MKKIISIAFMLIAFASCKSNSDGFTVSGKVKTPLGDSVYLELLSYDSNSMKVVDSAKIEKDGSYKLKGTSAQQNLYVVGFKINPVVILINDANDIKIDFDNSGFHYPDVSGSGATTELYKFIHDFRQRDSMLYIVYSQMDTVSKMPNVDTNYIKQLQFQYTQQLNNLSDVLRNFINTSKNPAGICFAFDKARGALSPDEIASLIQNAAKRFPNHTGISTFKNALAKAQQQQPENPYENYALLNQQAPDLSMQSIDGKTMHITDFKGKYLLVDFWASWCTPCRQENPNVVMAYNKFKNKNFTILGVSLDEDKQAWLDAVKKDNLNWNQMSDLKQWESAAVQAYQLNGIPFNVLLNPDGKIIAAGLRGEALEQKLNELLQ